MIERTGLSPTLPRGEGDVASDIFYLVMMYSMKQNKRLLSKHIHDFLDDWSHVVVLIFC